MGNMNETFFNNLDAAATWSAGVAFKRSKALPLDKYSVFETKALAEEYAERRGAYAETPVSYPGQVIVVSEGDKMVAYVLAEAADGSKLELQQIGIIPSGDGKTITVTEDGVISLLAADKEVFRKDEEGNDTEEKVINAGAQLVLQADGTIKWVQPDTSTAEGQAAAISALQDRATALEKAAIKPAEGTEAKPEENLWDAIEALTKAENERVDNDTTYTFADGSEGKFTVTPKDGEGIEIDTGAKDYVDAALGTPNAELYTSDTVYGAIDEAFGKYGDLNDKVGDATDTSAMDTVYGAITKEAEARAAAIGAASEGEDKPATGVYVAIEAEAARAAAAEKALDDAIKAIDFVDNDELADAIKDFATKKELSDGLAEKLDVETYNTDKQALEKTDSDLDTAVKAAQKTADEAKQAINDFLTGTGAEEVIDSLTDIKNALDELTDASELADAIASKADKVEGAVVGNFAGLDEKGNLTDSGKKAADFATAEQGAKADAAAVKTEVEAEFAKYTTTEGLTTLLAGKEAAGAADKALADAKADTDAKLANYYKNTEVDNLIKDFATTAEVATAKSEAISDADAKLANKANTADVYSKTEINNMDLASKTNVSEAVATETDRADKAEKALGTRIDELTAAAATKTELAGVKDIADAAATQTALQAEIDRATAAEGVNAAAITAIKDHESVDSFADVVAELAKKQDKLVEGAYATEAYVDGKVKVATDAAAAADAKGAQGIADAATAKAAADAAQTTANTNAANTDELEKVLYGRVITGTEEYPETVDTGLIGDLSDARARLAIAEGTIAGHTTAIGNINTALDGKADKTALQGTDAKVAALEGIVGKEAEGETPASGLVKKTADNAKAIADEIDRATKADKAHDDAIGALEARIEAEEKKVDNDTTYTFEDGVAGKFTVTPKDGEAIEIDTGATSYTDQMVGQAYDDIYQEFGGEEGRVTILEETIKGLSGAMHFKGVVTTDPTAEGFDASGYVNGDVVIYGNKEYVFNVVGENGAFVEFGDATGNASAITELDGRVSAVETAIGEAPELNGEGNPEGGSGLKKDIFNLGLELNNVRTIAETANDSASNAYALAEKKVQGVKTVEGCGLTATETVYGPDEADELGMEPGRYITIGWDNTVTIILDGGKA